MNDVILVHSIYNSNYMLRFLSICSFISVLKKTAVNSHIYIIRIETAYSHDNHVSTIIRSHCAEMPIV